MEVKKMDVMKYADFKKKKGKKILCFGDKRSVC